VASLIDKVKPVKAIMEEMIAEYKTSVQCIC